MKCGRCWALVVNEKVGVVIRQARWTAKVRTVAESTYVVRTVIEVIALVVRFELGLGGR